MTCPYCQQSLTEDSVQCVGCGLDLGRLDGVLGIPPVIAGGLTDVAELLSRAGARQVRRALAHFEERFPQVRVAVLLQSGPGVVPLRTWAWWLFNRGNFSAALDKGFVNRDVMLVVDPDRGQAALTIGYGLEPFVGQRDLAAALEAGQASLVAGEWAEACCQMLVALDGGLRVIVGRMSQTYGVPLPLLTETPQPAEAAAAW
jgi:hypothetical protein